MYSISLILFLFIYSCLADAEVFTLVQRKKNHRGNHTCRDLRYGTAQLMIICKRI